MERLTTIAAGIAGAWRSIVAAIAIAGLCLTLGYCRGASAARASCDAARALASTKAQEIDAHAKDKAAEDRVVDALAVEANEKDLIDAIASVPDAAPSRVRVAAGCQRLRAQGTGEADLPGVCRP